MSGHFDRLEQRLALSINSPLQPNTINSYAEFVDATDNVVRVQVTGSSGSAAFYDKAFNAGVEDGENIGYVMISGASADFQLTYTYIDNLAGQITDTIKMGNIIANGPGQAGKIMGVASVNGVDPLGNQSSFELYSYQGVDFTAGGGLSADRLVGDPLGLVTIPLGLGIQLNSLSADTDVNIRDYAGPVRIVVAQSTTATAAGTLNVNQAFGSDFVVGKTASSFVLQADGLGNFGAEEFSGGFRALSAFNGTMNFGQEFDNGGPGVTSLFLFDQGIAATADINGFFTNSAVFDVRGAMAGEFSQLDSDDLALLVSGPVAATARISGAGDVDLVVGGGVAKGATIVAGNELVVATPGTMSGSLVGNLVDVAAGRISGGMIEAAGDATIVTGSLDSSSGVEVAGVLTLVASTISKSTVLAGGLGIDTNLVTGSTITSFADIIGVRVVASGITGSTFNAAGDIELGPIGSNPLRANVTSSRFVAGDDITMAVAGTASRMTLNAGDQVDLQVDTDLTNSSVTAVGNQVIRVFRDAVGNTFSGGGLTSIVVNRNFKGSAQSVGLLDLFVVDGSVQAGSRLTQSGNVNVTVARGNFDATVACDMLELQVAGNVGKSTRITVDEINSVDGDSTTLFIGGVLSGTISTQFWNIFSGVPAVLETTVIAGGVAKTGRITVNEFYGNIGNEVAFFGGNYLGSLSVLGNLDQDLRFAGNVERLTVGGTVGVDGVEFVDIVVGGRLKSMSSRSTFRPQTAFEGLFNQVGAGVVTTTGRLRAFGGYGKVVPTSLL